MSESNSSFSVFRRRHAHHFVKKARKVKLIFKTHFACYIINCPSRILKHAACSLDFQLIKIVNR